MTIGELALRAELKSSALRYYEREGLLHPEGRTDGNYRFYAPSALERLRFIRAAQSSGLALGDIRTLLDFQDGSLDSCAAVQEVIESRLAKVEEQMKDLRLVQRKLRRYRKACVETARGERCPVLKELNEPDS